MSTRMFILSAPLVYISHDTEKVLKFQYCQEKEAEKTPTEVLFLPCVFNISLPNYI